MDALPVVESEKVRLTKLRRDAAAYHRHYSQTTQSVGAARRDVVEFARTCGFAGQVLCDIEVAVGEGLANAVEHGEHNDVGFEVVVRRDIRALVIEIKDSGSGFDHGAVTRRVRPAADALRGFGTLIMRELMDGVRYSEFGTRLQLSKLLPPQGPENSRPATLGPIPIASKS